MTTSPPLRLEDLVGQQRPVTVLRNAIRQDRVAHAYLFWGPDLVGKSTAAGLFARALNCEAEQSRATGLACGDCPSCRLIAGRNHPDVRLLTPGGEAQQAVIPIEEIRKDFVYDVHLKPLTGRYKIYIVDPADRTAPLAIHTILRALEEPPPYVVTILVTSLPAALPPTIPSRCQQVVFHLAGEEAIEEHLAALGVEPRTAASLAKVSGGRIGWAIRAASRPEVLSARTALLDLCAGLHGRSIGGALRVAEDVKLQALAVAGSPAESEAGASNQEEGEAAFRGTGERRARAELPWCLDVMVSWYRDVLSGAGSGALVNADYEAAVRSSSSPEALRQAERAIESILAAKRAIQRNANIDLTLESLSVALIGGRA